MVRTSLFLIAGVFAWSTTFCQKLTVTDVQIADKTVIVVYNLEEISPGNDIQVQLFSSIDNFVSPLKKVFGDVGTEVEQGLNKRMVWNFADEYPQYKGTIAVEVRGKAFVPVARFRNLENQIFKRGRIYTIDWKPGANKIVDIEVYNGSIRVQGESNISNTGSYNLHLLPGLRPGRDYRIKISDSRNIEEYSYSGYFTIKRKMPLLLKAVPLTAVVGAAAALVIKSAGDTGGSSTEIPGVPPIPDGN